MYYTAEMDTRASTSISLPPAMLKDLDRIAKAEHRSRSELLREAFRHYFELRYGEAKPTAAELRALERGRAAMKRGDYLTLGELRHAVETPHRKKRHQKA